MKLRQALRNIEIDKLIAGSHVEQLPEHIIDLILYFTYSYHFKNKYELRNAVHATLCASYPQNIKKYGNISLWDVSKVQDMSYMFYKSKFQGDISFWNVSNVQDMSNMFYDSEFNGDISRWDVSKVQDMSCMFKNSVFNGDISKWNVSKVTDMNSMFF